MFDIVCVCVIVYDDLFCWCAFVRDLYVRKFVFRFRSYFRVVCW